MAEQKYLRFPDSRPGICREAHEAGYCLGWCELPEELLPPIPIWDVPCPHFSKEIVEVKPYDMPAGLLFYLNTKP